MFVRKNSLYILLIILFTPISLLAGNNTQFGTVENDFGGKFDIKSGKFCLFDKNVNTKFCADSAWLYSYLGSDETLQSIWKDTNIDHKDKSCLIKDCISDLLMVSLFGGDAKNYSWKKTISDSRYGVLFRAFPGSDPQGIKRKYVFYDRKKRITYSPRGITISQIEADKNGIYIGSYSNTLSNCNYFIEFIDQKGKMKNIFDGNTICKSKQFTGEFYGGSFEFLRESQLKVSLDLNGENHSKIVTVF